MTAMTAQPEVSAINLQTAVAMSQSADADWTIKEIVQQPAIWEEALRNVEACASADWDWLAPLLARSDLRIILTGAGTSAYAGRMLAPVLTQTLGRRVEAIATTDIVSSPLQHLLPEVPTLIVSYARSGSSPESVAAFELAEQLINDCHQLILCCNPDSALVRACPAAKDAHCLLMPPAALDRSFAMTSSFSSMVLTTLCLFAPDLDQAEAAIRASRVLLEAPMSEIRQLVGTGLSKVAFLGSGGLSGLATEAALKTLELSAGRTDCYSESALGFRHGPKFVVDNRTLVVVMPGADPYTRLYDEDIFAELTSDAVARKVVRLDHLACLESAALSEAWLGLVYLVWCQMLAYTNSLALGLNPDNPCPSGEVNRVVQGVTIHPFGGAE